MYEEQKGIEVPVAQVALGLKIHTNIDEDYEIHSSEPTISVIEDCKTTSDHNSQTPYDTVSIYLKSYHFKSCHHPIISSNLGSL